MELKQCLIFGKRLADLRNSYNLTQKKLSDILNIQRVTIAKYEKGERSPMLDHVITFANYFNVTTDFLLGFSSKSTYEQSELNIADYAKDIVIKSVNNFSPEELGTLVYLCQNEKTSIILNIIYNCAAKVETSESMEDLVESVTTELLTDNSLKEETYKKVETILKDYKCVFKDRNREIESAKYTASNEFSNLLDAIMKSHGDLLTECLCLGG